MRISKAYELTVNDLLLVRKENHDLRAAHEKEKEKRQISKKQISTKQVITREEAQALVQSQAEASQAVTTTPGEPELPASQPVKSRFGINIVYGFGKRWRLACDGGSLVDYVNWV
ncbi:hypothetical protein TSTA_083620 [Talaromyces stipitatus ATCC 10500]|uniref:Uncharacterized protein n=1 Tax=Talaromyces stipitatus (strain ATCC 10500 / CBS 375.48 / QM 6759 / NRRL 1006) TaxID=441959 RepID=B8LZ86_TALSN|nr:uncharacterized protein TSTA_083620 [Talaromyces stipitatus ATCC 10500]EED21130.1 hypothetical protein TSTA_083620 [Talaromyces stipitatus ATCC 10500]